MSHRTIRSHMISTALLIALLTAATIAATPRVINYQGRLTDPAGSPVANNTYSVIFRIYDVSSGGSPIWSETRSVSTDGGLFSIVLGSVTPIPDTAISDSVRYLALQVGADPELSPRQRLTSVPYAINGGGWIDNGSVIRTADPSAKVGIGTSSPVNRLDIKGGNWNVAGSEGDVRIGDSLYRLKIGIATGGGGSGHCRIYGAGGISTITLGNDSGDVLNVHGPNVGIGTIWPSSASGGRTLDIAGGLNGSTLALRANPGTDWELHSGTVNSGTPSLQFSAPGVPAQPMILTSIPGDSSVILPDNAIDSREIIDEPGIVASQSTAFFVLNCSSSALNLLSVNVTIPAPGYIVIDGRCVGQVWTPSGLYGTVGSAILIDEGLGGPWTNNPYAAIFSYQVTANPSGPNYIQFPASVYRVFYKPAGNYIFYMKAAFYGNCNAGFETDITNCMMKATYYPTSYGSVSALATSSEANQFDKAEAVSVPTGPDGKGPATTMYQVDLRELELKAARLRANADKAERDLAEAKMNEMRRQIQTPPDKN